MGILDRFKDSVFSPKNIMRTAEAIAYSRFYSPNQDLDSFKYIASKLEESTEPSELLLDLFQVATRLYLYYSRKDPSEAGALSIAVSRIFEKNLYRALSGDLKITEREMARLDAFSKFWDGIVQMARTEKANLQEIKQEEKTSSYVSEGKYDKAIDDLESILETKKAKNDPSGEVETLRDIARVMEEKGDLEESLEYLKMAANIDPLAWSDVGFLLTKLELHEESISAYKKFLEKAPNNAIVLYNIGCGYEQLKKFSKALEYYELAIESNEDLSFAWAGKGVMLHLLGKNREATEAFKKALEIDPTDQSVLMNLTALYHDIFHDYKTALSYAKRAFNVNPENIQAKSNLAEILLTAGRYEEARDYAKQILELDATQNRRIAMYFVVSTSYFLEERVEEGNRNLEILIDYIKCLPETFTSTWVYTGISRVIAESKIQEDYKTKLLQTIHNLPHA